MENVENPALDRLLSQSKFWTHSTKDWTNFCEFHKTKYSTKYSTKFNTYMMTQQDLKDYIDQINEW